MPRRRLPIDLLQSQFEAETRLKFRVEPRGQKWIIRVRLIALPFSPHPWQRGQEGNTLERPKMQGEIAAKTPPPALAHQVAAMRPPFIPKSGIRAIAEEKNP